VRSGHPGLFRLRQDLRPLESLRGAQKMPPEAKTEAVPVPDVRKGEQKSKEKKREGPLSYPPPDLFPDLHLRQQPQHAPEDSQRGPAVPVHPLRGLFPPEGSPPKAPEDPGPPASHRHLRKEEEGGSRVLIL